MDSSGSAPSILQNCGHNSTRHQLSNSKTCAMAVRRSSPILYNCAHMTSLIVLFVLTSFTAAEVFTSSLKILDVAVLEEEVLDVLKQHIDAEYENLKLLSTLMNERSKQFHLQPLDAHRKLAQHPNGAYLLMKHYSTVWLRQAEIFPAFHSRLSGLMPRMPTHDDFSGAKSALVRLHYIYRLKVADMYAGNYSGYLGPPLAPQDAFDIGRQAFIDGFVEQAKQWLELAAEKLREEEERLEQQGINSVDKTLSWTLPLLGRTYYFLNDTEKASSLLQQCGDMEASGDSLQLAKELSGEVTTVYGHSAQVWHANMSVLCSRHKDHRVPEIKPYHVCRLKESLYLPYVRYKEEILSLVPYASVFYDIASDAEIDHLKGFVKDRMIRGYVGQGRNASKSGIRTSDLGWIHDFENPTAAALSRKVKDVTRLETEERHPNGPLSAEALQVVNYGLGGHYDAHMDPFDFPVEESILIHAGERIATFLIYLSDVEKGGHTVFLRSGISVAPVKGMALFWYNFEPHMQQPQQLTFHAGCPVLYGHKWIANKWIWTYGNTFMRPCGTRESATQIDVEKLVQSRGRTTRPRAPCANRLPRGENLCPTVEF